MYAYRADLENEIFDIHNSMVLKNRTCQFYVVVTILAKKVIVKQNLQDGCNNNCTTFIMRTQNTRRII